MKAPDGVYKHLPELPEQYKWAEDVMDREKIADYRLETLPDGRYKILLAPREGNIFEHTFTLEESKNQLNAINKLVAYVRARVI